MAEKSGWSIDLEQRSAGGSTVNDPLLRRQDPLAKKSGGRVPSFEATVGARCRLTGNLQFIGGARIEGSLQGEVVADADLVIGESAEVQATVQGQRVQIFGKVAGDVICSELLEIFSGAQVTGNISSPRLIIHDGVVFDGNCRMHSSHGDGEESGKVVELSSRDLQREGNKK